MGRSLVLAVLLLSGDNARLAPPLPEDPLVGSWLNPHGDAQIGTGAVCDFFPNQAWNCDCLNLYAVGSPTTWERLGENRYFFGTSGHKCWADATFDGDVATLSLRCGSYRPVWMGHLQPPVPLVVSATLVRYRYP